MFGLRARGQRTAFEFTISSNVNKWRLLTEIGFTPSNPTTIIITVESGVIVRDNAFGAPSEAMDLHGLLSGSSVSLINHGYIQGVGGTGGNGGGSTTANGANGSAAGNAILGPGAGITFSITNSDGNIWGGGGGGGGGGSAIDQVETEPGIFEPVAAGGGGAGGGAGGGPAGNGGGFGGFGGDEGDDGTAGTHGVSGTFGTGGNGGDAAGLGNHGGDAGDGGNWGSSGNAGATATGGTVNGSGGVAGAAGKAIELDGGSVTFVNGSSAPNVKGAVS